jgi:sterile alpha motif and leucine zipper-containing kinase AZK
MPARRGLAGLSFSLDDYEPLTYANQIGSGGYGQVHSVRRKADPTGPLSAIKCMRHSDFCLTAQIREIEILHQADHPATLQLRGLCLPRDEFGMLHIRTEYMANGSLDKIVKSRRAEWNATAVSKAMFGIVAAMAYLHSRGVMHRDLKPPNILVNDHFEIVICDFGQSRAAALTVSGKCGTDGYMAPEFANDIIAGPQAGFATDVFAFGIILVDLFLGTDQKQWVRKSATRKGANPQRCIDLGFRPAKPGQMPDWHFELASQCWAHNPSERPTFVGILDVFRTRHEYILGDADRAEALRYEEAVYRECGEPDLGEAGEAPFNKSAADEFLAALDTFLDAGIDVLPHNDGNWSSRGSTKA